MSWEGTKGMVIKLLLLRSDSHICEFILSNAIPMGCFYINEGSHMWLFTMNIWKKKYSPH